jgi:hypothetical protein
MATGVAPIAFKYFPEMPVPLISIFFRSLRDFIGTLDIICPGAQQNMVKTLSLEKEVG